MTRRKNKRKRGDPLHLDTVTGFTVAECRDVLQYESERFSDEQQQQIITFENEHNFSVERIAYLAPKKHCEIRFEGTLTPVAHGTRIQGTINDDTLTRIGQWYNRRRNIRIAIMVVFIAVALFAILIIRLNPWWLWLFLYLLPITPITNVMFLKRIPEQLVNWLDKYLYIPPEPLPLETVASNAYGTPEETQADDAIPAEEHEQRDQARTE